MLKKEEHVKFKNYERKIKSPFIIYAYFEKLSMRFMTYLQSAKMHFKILLMILSEKANIVVA